MKAAVLAVVGMFVATPSLLSTDAVAQIKPMNSGALSHGAPQMRRHGSGLHHPNRPRYVRPHRRSGFAFPRFR